MHATIEFFHLYRRYIVPYPVQNLGKLVEEVGIQLRERTISVVIELLRVNIEHCKPVFVYRIFDRSDYSIRGQLFPETPLESIGELQYLLSWDSVLRSLPTEAGRY